ncbi:MAG: sulfatase-like hydrolase/transferase [Candidatus Eisenbacteria bacterium]|nr:sulfatase-like hydrolase/transferase [Candidatus Eisenbacteria bacterium]MCC7142804.1 sulfatase-like hydrolase/transferase [Candidatus Eisenbacteria bacterium]
MIEHHRSRMRAGRRVLHHGAAPRLSILVVLLSLLVPLGPSAQAAVPSIILIVIDTLRADHLGTYGHHRPTSPALDRRAAQGAVFERAFASSGWTAPSFGSILTGTIAARHGQGARTAEGDDARHRAPLGKELPTLAEQFAARGYRTAAFVTNPFLDRSLGAGRGFEFYLCAPADNDRYRRADLGVSLAAEWLERHRDEPTFLLLHFFDPHLDYDPAPEVRGRFTDPLARDAGRTLPVEGVQAIRDDRTLSLAAREFITAAYDEEILAVDAALDSFFARLEELGLKERSVILLTADHGEELFDHGGFEHGHSLQQEILHVPFVLWGPGVVPARHTEPVSLVDVFPTLLEAAGVPATPPVARNLDGLSLWPLVVGRTTRLEGPASSAPREIVVSSTLQGEEQSALVVWPHKLIRTESGSSRLYQLDEDPRERQDLSAADPRRVSALARRLSHRLAVADSLRRRVSSVPIDPELHERLRSLGYTR